MSEGTWEKKTFQVGRGYREYAQSLFDLAASEGIVDDPVASGALRLVGARNLRWFKDPMPVTSELELVAGDARLADHDPLRQVANLQLADIAASEGNLEAARAYFLRSGLTEEQCSLLGVSPALRRSNASSSDYPMEALTMGFEGWVSVE